ncbi:hypothetical protein A9196_07030 [Aeromonas dhakensis]|nr:hypothetical protein A9196_07030 [Aeromonas dhakensis]
MRVSLVEVLGELAKKANMNPLRRIVLIILRQLHKTFQQLQEEKIGIALVIKIYKLKKPLLEFKISRMTRNDRHIDSPSLMGTRELGLRMDRSWCRQRQINLLMAIALDGLANDRQGTGLSV